MRTVTPKPFPTELELRSAKQLGIAVRAARTQARLTLADAALTLGVAKQTLSDLELGKPSVGLGLALRDCSWAWGCPVHGAGGCA